MKKYQLKYNFEVIAEFDNMDDILFDLRYGRSAEYELKGLSIWMNGQVLD